VTSNGLAAVDDDVRRRLIAEGRAVADVLLGLPVVAATPDAGAFLLRWCRVDVDSGRESNAASIVAHLLDRPLELSTPARWLMFCGEAATLAADARITQRAHEAASAIAAGWGGRQFPDAAAPALDACFRAAALLERRTLVGAVDELERIAAARYRPGLGIGGALGTDAAMASALLSAFEITGRLPYSMLAEELLETARRTLWDPVRGGFRNTLDDDSLPFAGNCEAALASARLARLHDSAEYRSAAVVAESDHRATALRTIDGLSSRWRDERSCAAHYGLAVAELVSAS